LKKDEMADSEAPLSEREIEVLQLVATGATNQEIARDLIISVNTVKVHLRNTFEKLGVQSRTEAALYAIREGWVVVDGLESEIASTETTPAPPAPRPLAWWQRIYALFALVLALTLLLVSLLWQGDQVTAAGNPISDQPVAGAASVRAETSRWTKFADLPTPRTRLALVAYNGRLFAIGGDRPTGVSDLLEIYSPESDAWTAGQSKPTAVSNVAAVVVDDRIYVPGGCASSSDVTDRLEVYNPLHDVWTEAAPMPISLCAYALAAVDQNIYLFGGWDGERFVDQVFAYDTARDEWADKQKMPYAKGFAAAAVLDGTIYVVGGYDGVNELADAHAYDPASDTWKDLSPMNVPRGGLGLTVVGDKLYAIGGGWQSYLATNERYDPKSDSWSAFESPVVGEWRNLGVATLGAQIYAVGGWNEGYLGVNEAYQAIYRIILPVAP
jgi:DNA-binding CsgD family transcriptional regulator/N-acetylneuraminic acid mutarotase